MTEHARSRSVASSGSKNGLADLSDGAYATRSVEAGQVVHSMPEADAERITLRISLKLDTMADAYQGVLPLIRDAIEREAWRALGYNGVSAWAEARFSGALTRLGMDGRRELVRELTATGMSTRAIAPVVGVTQKTIVKDLQVIPAVSPEEFDVGIADMTSQPAVENAQRSTVGRDGKTYTRSEQQPRQRVLAYGFRDAALDLTKIAARVERLTTDDRYPANRKVVARYVNDIVRAMGLLQRSLDLIDEGAS